MTSTKKKQTGLGAASYFADVPSLEGEGTGNHDAQATAIATDPQAQDKVQSSKIRRSYAIPTDAQLDLETIKLALKRRGQTAKLGDLLAEAIQLLAKEKGVSL